MEANNNNNNNKESDTKQKLPAEKVNDASKGNGTFDPADFQAKHPLQNRWTWWYDNPGKKTSQGNWGEFLKPIMTFDTVEDFWRLYNNIVPASKLVSGSDYHLFKEHIEPKWEDPVNAKGGKWIIHLSNKTRKDELDKLWLWAILAVIGENFYEEENDEVVGVVVSLRKASDRISLWTRNSSAQTAIKNIGKHLKSLLKLPENLLIGYQAHADCQKNNSSFKNQNLYEV